jgi:methionyl-tRNA formyltransferase
VKLIFAGTPEFAATALSQLITAGHEIALVLTQPDRPAGRGMKLQASPVKQLALEHAIPVVQPRSLRLDGKYPEDADSARIAIEATQSDAMVVAAYGLILPQWVLDEPRLGCFNIHASLLPRWRGAAPIHRSIEAGDDATGITIMQMDAGLDTGDMLLTETIPILKTATTGSLHDQLAELGGQLIVQTLADAAASCLKPVTQPMDGVTYAAKIDKHEALIDWAQPADVICRRVRAFNPFPGASSPLKGEMIKIWDAQPTVATSGMFQKHGEIVAVAPDGIAVEAMKSIVVIRQLQRAGGKRLVVADFLRGFDLQPGMAFELT